MRILALSLILAGSLVAMTIAQTSNNSSSGSGPTHGTSSEIWNRYPGHSPDLLALKTQPKTLTKKQQEEFKKNAQQMLQLTTELRNYLENPSDKVLSRDVAAKAGDIERLAKSMRKNSEQ